VTDQEAVREEELRALEHVARDRLRVAHVQRGALLLVREKEDAAREQERVVERGREEPAGRDDEHRDREREREPVRAVELTALGAPPVELPQDDDTHQDVRACAGAVSRPVAGHRMVEGAHHSMPQP
jgi:hypothetical protein